MGSGRVEIEHSGALFDLESLISKTGQC